MTYQIIDQQQSGMFENITFKTKEEIRQRLINFHSIDWTGENDIEDLTLEEICDYGCWEVVEINN
jgi:hypothetical protein